MKKPLFLIIAALFASSSAFAEGGYVESRLLRAYVLVVPGQAPVKVLYKPHRVEGLHLLKVSPSGDTIWETHGDSA
jgi:hypothetical protein